MYINPSWNYRDVIVNIRALKLSYEERLTSFLVLKQQNDFIRETRNALYSLNFEEFKKDRIWEYMNGYLTPWEAISIFANMKGD